MLYLGKKLINLSIFCEKIEFLKPVVKCLPLLFKKISKYYSRSIGYYKNTHFFKEYKGFSLYDGDRLDFEIPDFDEVRRDFGIKETPKYRKLAMTKFSSIRNLLNRFLLDGIIRNYKQENCHSCTKVLTTFKI